MVTVCKWGACIDDRNFRAPLEKLYEVYEEIIEFDRKAGTTYSLIKQQCMQPSQLNSKKQNSAN